MAIARIELYPPDPEAIEPALTALAFAEDGQASLVGSWAIGPFPDRDRLAHRLAKVVLLTLWPPTR